MLVVVANAEVSLFQKKFNFKIFWSLLNLVN